MKSISGQSAISPDGVTWKAADDNTFANANSRLDAIVYANNMFVAGGSSGIMLYSSDN